MVDPNPARGMPLQLQRYWLVGKGALKIRWDTPGDFMRCVHLLVKYFPKDPKGLCNVLHEKATGAAPGHGPAESLVHKALTHSSEAGLTAAAALLAQQPQLGKDLWAGPLAPINRPTGEPRRIRVFEPNSISHRDLPLPLRYQKVSADGHQGAVTVGRILGAHVGPDQNGQDSLWGWGDWLDPSIVPEVNEAKYMVDQGVTGTSLDPGGPVNAVLNPDTGAEHMTKYTMGGATLVAIPAFTSMRVYNLTPDGDFPNPDDPDMDMSAMLMDQQDDGGCGCSADPDSAEFTVNTEGWRGLPLAPRDAVFDNDEAVKRIAAWAHVAPQGTDVNKLHQAFMWQDSRQSPTDPTSYRMPLGDIINGRLTLVYHAIYAAAALLSGAHGGLPGVSEPDRAQLRNVISNIYQEMAKSFNDSTIRAPWDRPGTEGQFAVTNPNEPYGDVKYADPGYQGDKKKRYPIDTAEHVRAAWSYINQQGNASQYPPDKLKLVKARIIAAAKKFGINISDQSAAPQPAAAPMAAKKPAMNEYAMAESEYPLDPPLGWFSNPRLDRKTPVTVTPEGRVYGHLAAWGECHRDVTNRECVLAPKSQKGYAPFHLGQVYTAEGEPVAVGKIVMDTRHADINLGYSSAALHYDDTGDEVAVVRAGEDEYGIWVAGSVVPEATPSKVAKLRRSPLSGDWRRVDGNLELCAALAVNVPAFPVYAMDGTDQLALVAAGTVMPEYEEPFVPSFGLEDAFAAAQQTVAEAVEQEDRAWRLRELIDDDETSEQDARIDRLAAIFAADATDAPLSQPAGTVPAPAAGAAPGAGDGSGGDVYSDTAMLSRQMNARYTIVPEADNPPPTPPQQQGAPAAPGAAPAPAPVSAPAPTPAPAPAPTG